MEEQWHYKVSLNKDTLGVAVVPPYFDPETSYLLTMDFVGNSKADLAAKLSIVRDQFAKAVDDLRAQIVEERVDSEKRV